MADAARLMRRSSGLLGRCWSAFRIQFHLDIEGKFEAVVQLLTFPLS